AACRVLAVAKAIAVIVDAVGAVACLGGGDDLVGAGLPRALAVTGLGPGQARAHAAGAGGAVVAGAGRARRTGAGDAGAGGIGAAGQAVAVLVVGLAADFGLRGLVPGAGAPYQKLAVGDAGLLAVVACAYVGGAGRTGVTGALGALAVAGTSINVRKPRVA